MAPTGVAALLVTCSAQARDTEFPRDLPAVTVPPRPGKAEIDPVLAEVAPRRLVVAGTDADLAAVLVRLLRTERLDVEVAYVPADRSSDAARTWGLPRGRSARELALHGTARPVPLVRDDVGGVLAGRGEIRGLRGECYCDETLVLRGGAPRLVVAPTPAGIAVRAGRGRRLPSGAVRAVAQTARTGRGAAIGRAVQIGCLPATVLCDGVAHPRPMERFTWFRHTSDWLLVRG
ncbi:MAG: hypothetical protein AB7J32_17215 [Pseudonocardia sp.]